MLHGLRNHRPGSRRRGLKGAADKGSRNNPVAEILTAPEVQRAGLTLPWAGGSGLSYATTELLLE